MQPTGLVWGLVAVIAVLTILSSSIIAGVIIHSRKIRESENKFRLLFNRVHDALIVFNRGEGIIGVNESTCRLLGFGGKELLKLCLKDIIQKDKWLELHEAFSKIFSAGDEFRGESILIDSEGKTLEVEVIGVNLKFGVVPFILTSFRDITLRKKSEAKLMKKHYALQEVLAHMEEEKQKIKHQVAKTVDQVLMPALNRMVNDGKPVNLSYYEVLKSGLEELSNASGGMLHALAKLTPREIEICNFIKSGATSKEIATNLNISMLTVNKHRERIRRKLAISNKNVNLTSYLKRL